MRFIFVPGDCFPFHGKTIEERPLGGIETGVVRLAEALCSRGHEVYCATPLQDIPSTPVKYIHQDKVSDLEYCDVYVAVRRWQSIFNPRPYMKACLFWTGDMWNVVPSVGIGDNRVINRLNALLGVSGFHIKILCERSGFPISKTWVLRNGVHLPYFEGEEIRNPKRLIYSSTPDRGLKHLLPIYKILKEKHPDLELHLFTSLDRFSLSWSSAYDPQKDVYKRWDNPSLQNQEMTQLMKDFSALPGCVLHGSVTQKLLAREFMKSAILTYPSDFHESSCITAMEAQAAGCAVVATDIGALKETIGEAGVLIEDNPASENYRIKFVNAVDRLLSDPAYFQNLSEAAKRQGKGYSWEKRADSFLEYLKIFFGLGVEK